jgi:hypothetical protein
MLFGWRGEKNDGDEEEAWDGAHNPQTSKAQRSKKFLHD